MTQDSKPNPQAAESQQEPAFGWTTYAEQINGRFAMIGLVLLLVLEFFTRQDIYSWLGW
ncbi:MAG: chlorophyll a/b-binding protein [Synechococcales bacterium]|nr:chlorophyll a/b-binding protein [Synechococcales bacterium]